MKDRRSNNTVKIHPKHIINTGKNRLMSMEKVCPYDESDIIMDIDNIVHLQSISDPEKIELILLTLLLKYPQGTTY